MSLRRRLQLLGAAALLVLGGCAAFPHDGPSTEAVIDAAIPSRDAYALIDLGFQQAKIVESTPNLPLAGLGGASSDAPVDQIGPGDSISVAIYEGSAAAIAGGASSAPQGAVGTANVAPRVTVDAGGFVDIPYAGRVRVGGLTPSQASAAIRAALRGKLVSPQVLVSLVENISSSVTVIGEVRTGGRFPLTANGDRLLDVIALAGGPTKPIGDTTISLVRGSTFAQAPLSNLLKSADENVRLAPRDQIRVLYTPRKFSSFGALGRIGQIAIEDETLSLAGALSRFGGLDSNLANASAVFVFRFERPEVARALGETRPATESGVPVVYRLNLREPSGFFVAEQFSIRAGDILYVPRAGTAELRKFLDMVTDLSQVAYNVRVTTVLN
jgi:polysaccharide export outer membrane protein